MQRAPGRLPIARLIGIFVALSVLPLALLTWFTLRLASNAVEGEVKARARSTAALSAVAIQKEMQGLSEVVESYAKRPALVSAVRDPRHFDTQMITVHLEQLQQERSGIATAFLADPGGRLIAVVPATPSIVGQDFSFRDWYRGVTAAGDTYISEAYQSLATGHPRVVAAATLVREDGSPRGRVDAILVAAYDLQTIQAFVDRFAASQGVRLTLTDQRGVLLAAPGASASALVSRLRDPVVEEALRGASGVTVESTVDGSMLSAYLPISGLGWTLTASIPEERAFAAVGNVGWTVLAVAGVLGLVLLGGLAILGLTLRDRRRAERALQEREEMMQAVFAASPDIITVIRPGGEIAPSSPAIKDLLGYEPEERAAADRFEIIHPDDRERLISALQSAAETGRTLELRYRIRHADGRWLVLESRIRGITDSGGRPSGAVSISRDVTEKAALEGALREAKDEAEGANRAKSEFLSRMSHELRTPLNAVLGFGQLLEMEDLDTSQRESVEQILKGGRHLLDLINEVLDIARIEAGRITLSLEPVAVKDALLESLDLIRPQAADCSVDLRVEASASSDPYCLADRQRLKQVLLNLLSNAVKYNRRGGSVTVRAVEIPGDRLRLEVSDQGAGIASDKLVRLFTPFDRLGAEQTTVEGVGLGLALSKRLVEAMGGVMTVESAVGVGSTFAVELPLAQPAEELADENGGAEPLSERPMPRNAFTLLYIEDNPANLRLIQRLVSRRPEWKLLAAMQGSMGLDLARQHRPDLVLLDMHLPDLSGEEVFRALLADPRTRDIPVVVVSADATPAQIRRMLGAGAKAYLTKPLDVRRFLQLMDETLTAGRLNNAG